MVLSEKLLARRCVFPLLSLLSYPVKSTWTASVWSGQYAAIDCMDVCCIYLWLYEIEYSIYSACLISWVCLFPSPLAIKFTVRVPTANRQCFARESSFMHSTNTRTTAEAPLYPQITILNRRNHHIIAITSKQKMDSLVGPFLACHNRSIWYEGLI